MVNDDQGIGVCGSALREQLHQAVGHARRFLPSHLAIETVRACNAKCIMCPSETMVRAKGTMQPEVHQLILQKVLDWGAPINLITHAGLGEPLLDKRLEARIATEKAAFPQAQVAVYTNGALLTEDRARLLLESGLDVLSVSINGFRKKTYEAVMKLPHATTFRQVERFLEMKRAAGSTMQLHVSLVRTELCSDQEVAEFKTYWHGRVDAVVTPEWITWGGFLDQVAAAEQFPCSYIWKTMMIDFDGTVKMCCEDYDSIYPMGSLVTQDPEEIFNSPRMQDQRGA
ncbi:MAG: radical SAM/SPASM domain-containing protein, partial [Planctomycetota bacterium]